MRMEKKRGRKERMEGGKEKKRKTRIRKERREEQSQDE